MSQTIPLRSDLQHFDLQVVLDARTYTLEFRWNVREGAWYMSVNLENGIPVRSSLKVVVDHPIGGRTRSLDWPAGAFFAVDTSTQRRDPELGDLGDRVLMVYFPASELPIDPGVL